MSRLVSLPKAREGYSAIRGEGGWRIWRVVCYFLAAGATVDEVGADVNSRRVNQYRYFVMTALTVEIFFVGVTRMVSGDYKDSILKPRFLAALSKNLRRAMSV